MRINCTDDLKQEVLSELPDKSQTGLKMIAYAIVYLAETIRWAAQK